MGKSRLAYSKEDDLSIVQFLLEGNYLNKGHLGFSLNLWKEAEKKCVTQHSAESMRNRFRRYLYKNLSKLKKSILTSQDKKISWLSSTHKPLAKSQDDALNSPLQMIPSPSESYSVSSNVTSQELHSEQLKQDCSKTHDILDSSCHLNEPENHSQSLQALQLSNCSLSTETVSNFPKLISNDDSTFSQHSEPPEIPPTCDNDVLESFSENMWISVSYALYSFLHYVSSCYGITWNDTLDILLVTKGDPQQLLSILANEPSIAATLRAFPGKVLFPSTNPFHPFNPSIRVGPALSSTILDSFLSNTTTTTQIE
ncbi:telomeric repeat-binding factor 2-interacting protein 1-like [Hylaeus volcanicus]|uniref:telomeric repeat-binding factor 2-interacting protein 1-like n=1 Tax=Hylaeus volcanicus TaxID=313075 RepID=UPI0023B86561|nr:telomeric repeat-binding factor 2-interacting protein 1-like [Hylaeus volcanicus]